jgi:hypothetical protein
MPDRPYKRLHSAGRQNELENPEVMAERTGFISSIQRSAGPILFVHAYMTFPIKNVYCNKN